MNATKTNMRTADGLTVYDLAPEAGDLYAVAGPDGFDPSALAAMAVEDRLPAGFRWVTDKEWSGLVCGVKTYTYRTDSERGAIEAVDFDGACGQLDAMFTPELIADGAWGWVEDADGYRHYVARENMP